MSGKSRQSGDTRITVRYMFHTRITNLIRDDPAALNDLMRLLNKSSLLSAAYRFAQRVYGAHDKKHLTPDNARKRVLKAWAALPDAVKKKFPKFKTVITTRSEEYFSTWEKGAITNGVTEAMNRTLRDIYRAGRGLRFEELRLRAIYSASPTERMMRAKFGEPDPIDQARALIRGEHILKQVRTVARHGLHEPGRRPRKMSAKQMELFPEWT